MSLPYNAFWILKNVNIQNFFESYENEKLKNNEIINDFSEKTHKATRELEKLTDEQTKALAEITELRNKITLLQAEKNSLQKALTKEVI